MAYSKPLTLKHSVIWGFIGTGVWSLCNWLMATVLAKLGTPIKLGEYSLANAVCGPVFICSYLGLHSLMVTDGNGRFPFRDYFSLRVITSTAALVLVAVVGCLVYGRHAAIVIAVVALGMWFDSLSDIIYAIFQSDKRADNVGRSMLIKGILNLAFFTIGMLLTRNVVWAAIGSSVASLTVVVFYDAPVGYSLLKRSHTGYKLFSLAFAQSSFNLQSLSALGHVVLAAVPLGLVGLFGSLTGCLPQYVIAKHLGDRELGLYSAAAYLINVGRVGVMAAGVAANPFLAKAYAAGNYIGYRNMVAKLLCLGVGLAVAAPVAAALVGHKVMSVLYTAEYGQSTLLIVLILLAGGVRYLTSLIGFCVTAARVFNVQVGWFGATLAVAVASNLWLVPKFGLMGAGVAAGITAATELLIGLIILFSTLTGLRSAALHAATDESHDRNVTANVG